QDAGHRVQVAGKKAEGRRHRVQVAGSGEKGKRKEIQKNTVQGKIAVTEKAGAKQQAAGEPQISNRKSQISNPEMPLNKFIAWSGVCGRREAADLIKAGKVTVNNQ